MKHKYWLVWLSVGLAMAFAVSAYIGYRLGQPLPQEKPLAQMTAGEVEKAQVIFLQGYDVCMKHNLDCLQPLEAPEDIDLSQITQADIEKRYPKPQWVVRANGPDWEIIQCQQGLCSVHQKIAHLGANATGEYLAVYKGPAEVGTDGGVWQVTDIAIAKLAENVRQDVLAGTLEIYSEEELIGLLDGLSENQ